MITTNQLLDRLKMRNPRTLTRWQEFGLLPKPIHGKHPSGRGMALLYPDDVVEQCKRVLKFQKAGRTFDEIKYMIGLPEVEAVLTRPKGAPVEVEKVFCAFVLDYARKLLPEGPIRHELVIALNRDKVYEQATQLLQASSNPVLLLYPPECIVCPDFLVSLMLADIPSGERKPYLAIPLVSPIYAAHDALKLPRPPVPQKTPVAELNFYHEESGEFARYQFIPMGKGRHEISLKESSEPPIEAPEPDEDFPG